MLFLNRKGFTLVEIMIVVAIIGLLAVIAIPNFVKARQTAQQNACFNNMRQIEAAIQQWALATRQADGTDVDETAIGVYIRGGMPGCPASGTYTIGNVGDVPAVTCGTHGSLPLGYE